jgi:hypothetical protein
MSRPTPTIGDVNIRGFILPDTCAGKVCALPSLYGDFPADQFNPCVFPTVENVTLPVGSECLFHVAATWDGRPFAKNVRAA